MSEPYRICVVCTGNICRSPMGEFVLRERFAAAGLDDVVEVDSAGTTQWEVGNPPDPRTLAVMERRGHDVEPYRAHRARSFERGWFGDLDLVLAADHGHYSTLRRLARSPEDRDKVVLFRDFDPRSSGLGMDDPWYGDDSDFEQTYDEVVAAADGVVEHVQRELGGRE